MKEESLAMALIKSKDKIIIVLVVAWFLTEILTIGGFLWYINQFDYTDESTATIETDNSGNIITGDIDNG